MSLPDDYIKGRGAQVNTHNRFEQTRFVREHWEAIDEDFSAEGKTEYIPINPKTILNKVESTDLPFAYSMNPYQGCEHGCIYCYARPTHEYWGYSAGVEFERKILIKKNAPELLAKAFSKKGYQPYPIMFSGNTDCYQPIERKLGITRKMLEVCLKYRHPVGLITKNALILRDLDILKEMAALKLLHVSLSITTLQDDLRRLLEPRTASVKKKLETLRVLSEQGIPVNVMMAPIIPALNSSEILQMAETVSALGALDINYTVVRLNGALSELFSDWVHKNFPDRAEKVLHQIADCHGGKLNDSRAGLRMRGEGQIAIQLQNLFRLAKNRYFKGKSFPSYDMCLFDPNAGNAQLSLF